MSAPFVRKKTRIFSDYYVNLSRHVCAGTKFTFVVSYYIIIKYITLFTQYKCYTYSEYIIEYYNLYLWNIIQMKYAR